VAAQWPAALALVSARWQLHDDPNRPRTHPTAERVRARQRAPRVERGALIRPL